MPIVQQYRTHNNSHSSHLHHTFPTTHSTRTILRFPRYHLFQLGLRQRLALADRTRFIPVEHAARLDAEETRAGLVDAGDEGGDAERSDGTVACVGLVVCAQSVGEYLGCEGDRQRRRMVTEANDNRLYEAR